MKMNLFDEEGKKPEIAELDELQTYLGKKTQHIWVWIALNHYFPGILTITVGDRNSQTFSKLWHRVKAWGIRRYITDASCVYANYIDAKKPLILPKTQMIRVEGENTRV